MSPINSLLNQTITISLEDDGTYTADFAYCNMKSAYDVLKTIVKEMEAGFPDSDSVKVYDINGDEVDKQRTREVLDTASPSFDLVGDPGEEPPTH